MKRLLMVLAFILAACLFLSACGEVQAPPASPAVSKTAEASASTPKPTPVVTPEPTSEEDDEIDFGIDEVHAYLQERYSWAIEYADKYRITIGDTEYYLDTSKIIEMDESIEFPLYRQKQDEEPEYLGTTGFSFQVFGDYIYVQSDQLQEGPQDGTLTRIVNLKDLSVTQAERDMNIFIPKEGNKVYYTYDGGNYIFISDTSLKHPKILYVEVSDKDIIEKKIELRTYVDVFIGITDVKDGWIYFSYSLFIYDIGTLYEGNYRIKTDGSEIEKTDEGQFGDEIDYKE